MEEPDASRHGLTDQPVARVVALRHCLEEKRREVLLSVADVVLALDFPP